MKVTEKEDASKKATEKETSKDSKEPKEPKEIKDADTLTFEGIKFFIEKKISQRKILIKKN